MQRVIAILNLKGGTAKTTLATNVAYGLSTLGCHVLLVDCDLQRNASGLHPIETSPTLTQVIKGEALFQSAIVRDIRPGLDLLPSDRELDTAATHIPSEGLPAYNRIRNAVSKLKSYDFVFFDLPANYTPLTEAILYACSEMLVPVMLEPFAVDGLILMMDKVGQKLTQMGHEMEILGIVPMRANFSEKMTQMYINDLKEHYPDDVLAHISTDANVKKAQSRGLTVIEAYPDTRATGELLHLAQLIKG